MSLPKAKVQRFLQPLRSTNRQFHLTHIRPRPHSSPSPIHPHPHPHPPKGHHGGPINHLGAGSSSTTAASSPSNGSSGGAKKKSPHLVWYREIVPAMVPILLLSSTIFLSLTLLRTHLSHSLSLAESSARIAELEVQLDQMRRRQLRLREKERKERERILPLVVERVLQKVGAMSEEEEEVEEDLPFLV